MAIEDALKTSAFVRATAFALISITLLFLLNYFPASYTPLNFFSPSSSSSSYSLPAPLPSNTTFLASPPIQPLTPPQPKKVVEMTGIVDGNGVMALEFEVGDIGLDFGDEALRNYLIVRGEAQKSDTSGARVRRIRKFRFCEEGMRDYIPCLDNVKEIRRLSSSERGEKYERHCPNKSLDCLVPWPKRYRSPIPWPRSKDEVWFSNIPHAHRVEDKRGQNWLAIRKDKINFPEGGTRFTHGVANYLDQISQMVPAIAFGHHTRVALDIGCGVASFGAFLMQRNVTTLSIAPKDVHENHIQLALERGVPAMVAVLSTRRLSYPSQAFDLIHCSGCRVNWTRDDGILLLEVNRMLRAGGYFVWALDNVYKHEEVLQEWKDMEELAVRMCWELAKKEGYTAIWRKPLNNSCYLSRSPEAHPPLCDSNDDPDKVWYVDLKACITRLPDNGYGANVTEWPARLHQPPERLLSIELDADISRKDLFKAESKYWNEVLEGYIRVFRWRQLNLRNVLDMRAGFGGFAAALHDYQIDCWVMNVVPTSGFNTLPVIYDRGFIGVMHDWCEPFDTYPRTYDLLHAAALFSVERKRCNISTIMLEMDRMLRPGGQVYIRDSVTVMSEVQEIASAMGWIHGLHDTGEGPHASWKILICEKRF